MKPAFFLFLILNLHQACVPTYINRIKVTTTSIESHTKDIIHNKNLLFIASGNISTRVVTTNLHLALNKMMQKNGSKSDFEFKNIFSPAQNTDISKIGTFSVGSL